MSCQHTPGRKLLEQEHCAAAGRIEDDQARVSAAPNPPQRKGGHRQAGQRGQQQARQREVQGRGKHHGRAPASTTPVGVSGGRREVGLSERHPAERPRGEEQGDDGNGEKARGPHRSALPSPIEQRSGQQQREHRQDGQRQGQPAFAKPPAGFEEGIRRHARPPPTVRRSDVRTMNDSGLSGRLGFEAGAHRDRDDARRQEEGRLADRRFAGRERHRGDVAPTCRRTSEKSSNGSMRTSCRPRALGPRKSEGGPVSRTSGTSTEPRFHASGSVVGRIDGDGDVVGARGRGAGRHTIEEQARGRRVSLFGQSQRLGIDVDSANRAFELTAERLELRGHLVFEPRPGRGRGRHRSARVRGPSPRPTSTRRSRGRSAISRRSVRATTTGTAIGAPILWDWGLGLEAWDLRLGPVLDL